MHNIQTCEASPSPERAEPPRDRQPRARAGHSPRLCIVGILNNSNRQSPHTAQPGSAVHLRGRGVWVASCNWRDTHRRTTRLPGARQRDYLPNERAIHLTVVLIVCSRGEAREDSQSAPPSGSRELVHQQQDDDDEDHKIEHVSAIFGVGEVAEPLHGARENGASACRCGERKALARGLRARLQRAAGGCVRCAAHCQSCHRDRRAACCRL